MLHIPRLFSARGFHDMWLVESTYLDCTSSGLKINYVFLANENDNLV